MFKNMCLFAAICKQASPRLHYVPQNLQNSLFAGVFFQLLVLKKYNYVIRNWQLPFRWPRESSTASCSKSFYCCPFIFNTLLQYTFISTPAKCAHWFPMVSLEEGSASLMMSTKGGWPHSHSNANPALLHFCLDHTNIWPAKNSLPSSYRTHC